MNCGSFPLVASQPSKRTKRTAFSDSVGEGILELMLKDPGVTVGLPKERVTDDVPGELWANTAGRDINSVTSEKDRILKSL